MQQMTSQAPLENSDHGSGFKSLGLVVYDVTGAFWLLVNFVVKITACKSEALSFEEPNDIGSGSGRSQVKQHLYLPSPTLLQATIVTLM